ncbi:MAG: serine/threonine-protein kinase [Chthoniobacter sp.]|nr:serine/threonine-protein kinase [Chthoniobacter sp.]
MPTAPDRTNFSFGHYTVLTRPDGRPEELGRGAMGITYKALDTTLERHVALKVINPDQLTSEETRQRFLREARATAQLRHPNVAGVFHLGAEGGTHYYAMEFIDGETLETLVHRLGPLPCGRALDLAAQAAGALGAAYAARLVHRDIKPANLMVINQPGGRLLLKVIDFGLAKTAVTGARDATLTVGGFLGTPHFASPEQLEEKDLDIRSDIYSLGATLWYLLTAQTLYAGSLARVMIGHISETPPFDCLVAPPAVRALLRRMLAKNPEDRPQTPDNLLTEIQVATSQIGDPQFACRLERASSTPGCAFTLQELLRVRRFLPPGEAMPILRKIAEALDSVDTAGRAQVDLNVNAIAIDFPEQATFAAPEMMRQPVTQWPAFGLKFRDLDPTTIEQFDTLGSAATLFASPAPRRDEGYLQRLAGIASELLGGRQRAENSATPFEFAPLAALSEEGNAVLQAALTTSSPAAYASGAEFLDALQNTEGVATLAPATLAGPATAIIAPTQRFVAPAPPTPQRSPQHRLAIAAAAVVVAGGAAAAIIATHHPTPPQVAAKPTPALVAQKPATPLPATPAPVAVATPAPTPAPAELTPEQKLQIAIGQSAEFEAANNWNGALQSAVGLVHNFPDYNKGPARLDELIERMNAKGEFAHRWPAYESLLNQASELGSGRAAWLLGLAAEKSDPTRAVLLLGIASDHGVREAMTATGLIYLHGDGVPKDVVEAERWFQKASDHGDPAGMFILGESYLSGKGVKQDNAKALKLIQEAADHRSGDAKNLLGKLYLYGRAGLTANRPTALEYFRQAKDLKCPEAFYNLGMLANSSKGPLATPARAATLFEGGAKLGNALCMFNYGRCLDQGSGVPMSKADATTWYAKAIDPLKKEAEDGARAAMVCYAMALDEGLGIDRNPAEAKRWYAKAATLGDAIAQQWCLENHVAFQGPMPNTPAPPVTTLPNNKNYFGKRFGRLRP